MSRRRTALALLLTAALAGCGSEDDPLALPPPPGPAASPPQAGTPEGEVVPAGDLPEGVAFDARRTVAALPGGGFAVLDPRRRTLGVTDRLGSEPTAEAPAGVGPTHVVAGDDGRVYVTDTGGESVLLFRVGDDLELARRYGLPGAPYATTIDRDKGKLWVTLTARNEAVQLTADAQPREQRRYRTVRRPDAIAIDERTGRVYVAGRDEGVLQAFDGYAQDP